MTKIYQFRVRMRQRFEFPVDMLRYDRCWPASEAESVKVSVATKSARDWVEGFVADNIHEIELCGLGSPTEGRWLSFGWEVAK